MSVVHQSFSSEDRLLPVVTGFGCVSPLGCGLAATRKALHEGHDGISEVREFSVSTFHAKTAGQVENFEDPGIRGWGRWSRAAKLVLPAVREALNSRPGFVPDIIVAGTTSGGMDLGENFFRGLSGGMSPRDARRWVRGYVPQQPVRDVMAVLGLDAPVRLVSNACASGTNALCLAAGLVRSGQAKRVMAIGFDALSEMVFAGFDALQASTREKCRPFDSARSGLALGEGAACFLLEAAPSVCESDVLASIPGWGFVNDNHHLTQPNPDGSGPRRSMQRALVDAGWETTDYINAHGTGTLFNDSSEAAAIRSVCPDIPVSSTKGMTGHALGAAGAIEAAFCIIAMQDGFMPPNINLRETDSGLDIVANTARPATLRRVMSNSFGFGGANATVLLERIS
ncbi:MAG: beta-ketoacyl-[acyl-carrier-protein] synthase family protein [Verrucomicrobiaceae bacterium]|nr:MAG: beta-ketoacyl-[acyl-carrier-protein] synthase family protein [Verrucomicrobiaceae bacterium]